MTLLFQLAGQAKHRRPGQLGLPQAEEGESVDIEPGQVDRRGLRGRLGLLGQHREQILFLRHIEDVVKRLERVGTNGWVQDSLGQLLLEEIAFHVLLAPPRVSRRGSGGELTLEGKQ